MVPYNKKISFYTEGQEIERSGLHEAGAVGGGKRGPGK